ncbi:thaumatin family-domain-containing protein [Rhodotorula diobovata]|uniref:Thaumatin family-domain-containing protein n=1 Tax=Rhodotorula diobovata TaxID=5288 RepID=A0A5C5G7S2_9BASI|nr:thaumatin family-domain-containing protein [Rhodotorula diobovata]
MHLAPRVFLTACFAALASTCLANTPKDRRISVVNQCTFPVWPALFTSVGPRPSHETGWKAAPGSSVTFTVKEGWGGRIWGRTGCDFSDSSKPDYEQCETGGCVGGLRCDPDRGTGVPPVTLAEFNLQSAVDNYDTSLVDGNNLAIALTNSADCPLSNCPYNLLKVCPEELQKKNVKGKVVGCLTACSKWGNEEYCCSGAHSTPETCPASGVKYYDFWKRAAPLAYAFAYDEASGTALFTCTKQADWTITFCPDASLFATTALLPNGTTITQGKGLELFPTYSPKKVRRVSVRGHNKAEVAAGSGH